MRSFIIVAIIAAAIAYAAPDILHSWSGESADAPSRQTASENSRSNDYRREVEIPSSRDGHFYMEARIDGRGVEVMLDTGASMVALRESDARRAGIRVHRNDFDVPVSTANGTAYYAPVTLRRVEIDGIEIRDVRAAVLPDDQLHISLLGATFLNQLRRFEVADNVLVMEN